MLETITCRTHYTDAVYTFALVLLRHFPVLQIQLSRERTAPGDTLQGRGGDTRMKKIVAEFRKNRRRQWTNDVGRWEL